MRFKKAIAAGVAACVMAASAASLVKSVSALSMESHAAAVDVTVELVGVTDDYAAKVPLGVVLDNMTYAHDFFAETAPDDDESETPGVSESEPGDTSTDVSEPESEPAETSEPESEPADESAPEAAEAPAADEEEPEEISKPESEPADIINIPEEEVPEASAPDNENSEIPEDNEEPEASIIPEAPEETTDVPEPLHKRGDKVELPDGAEFVWVDGEQYSISDKNAVLDLFVEDSADEYIVEKTLTIGTQAENTVYNVRFMITKNRWTFEDFELYTTDADGGKTALNAVLYEIGVNSAKYLITSELGERGVYLKLSPKFMKNGEIAEDVDVDVIYRGADPVDSRILTDGGIVVDLLAFDAEHNLIAEQRDVAITVAAGTLRLGAALDYEKGGEAPVIIDAACTPDPNGSAELVVELEESFFGAEHTIIIGTLSTGFSELSEDDVLKTAFGRFDSPADAADAEDIKAALFGKGFAPAFENGTELTLFIEQRAIFGISAGEEPLAAHVRFIIKDITEAPEIPEEPTDPEDPEEPGDDPENPEAPEQPIIPEIPQEPETVELYYDGDGRIYFDNISKGEVVLEITSNTDDLTSLEVALEDAALVTLGEVDVRGNRSQITLNGVRGTDGELLRGEVSGTLVITADNAEPLEIMLGGESGSARLVERKTWDTAMKYVPYLAEYSLDGEYSWLNAEYSVIGELPEGLELDAQTGKLSGAPVEPGKYSFEIAATLTYIDAENLSSATITREVGITVANNTAGNLYMLTDPEYGFYRPLGEDIDGRAYYLDREELSQKLIVTLKGECSEFYDLWLDGVKLTRRSDDYKTYHGATEITFDEGALSWLSVDEIHTLVFAYKPNSSDNLKLAAQNLIITSDKSAIVASGTRDYYNMYTPTSKLSGKFDSSYTNAISSVRLYAANGTLPAGVKTLVRANAEESKGGIGMDIIIADESGEQLLPNGSVTAKMNLTEFFGDDVYVYFLEDGKYRETSATVRDGQVFFTLDSSKTVIVSQRTIDPNAKSSGNPATGVAVSSMGLVISGAALVMILTGRRKENA